MESQLGGAPPRPSARDTVETDTPALAASSRWLSSAWARIDRSIAPASSCGSTSMPITLVVFAGAGPVHHQSLCTTSARWQTLWMEPTGRSGHGSDRGDSFARPHSRAAPEPLLLTRWEAAGRSRGRFRKTFSEGGGGADTTGVSADILRVLVRRVGAASQHAERPRPGMCGRRGEPDRSQRSRARVVGTNERWSHRAQRRQSSAGVRVRVSAASARIVSASHRIGRVWPVRHISIWSP
jgi:hypothetical protein